MFGMKKIWAKKKEKKTRLMTSGSSASIGCVRIGVAESADGCGRGAKGGTAPNVGWDEGGAFTACEGLSSAKLETGQSGGPENACWHRQSFVPVEHRALGSRFQTFQCRRLIRGP